MSIGFWQIVLVLAVVLVLFGAGKIPKAMGDLGRGLRSFKKGLQGEKDAETPQKKLPSKTKAPAKKQIKKPAARKPKK